MLPDEVIMSKIFLIRGKKVMIDRDLAELYETETKVLKQAVRRNKDIFPEHFMFELTEDEFKILRSQSVTSRWGGQRYLPFVFTEHGILQIANVIRSLRAINYRNLDREGWSLKLSFVIINSILVYQSIQWSCTNSKNLTCRAVFLVGLGNSNLDFL